MNALWEDVASRFERLAIAAGEHFIDCDNAVVVLEPTHSHRDSLMQQRDAARAALFEALSDLEFVKRTTAGV